MKRKQRQRGRKPDRLVIDSDWGAAIAKSLKKKPAPKPPTSKKAPKPETPP